MTFACAPPLWLAKEWCGVGGSVCVTRQVMVTYGEVGRRHGVYAMALCAVITTAEYTLVLSTFLLACLLFARCHMRSPPMFTVATTVVTPLVTGLCVKLSHHTWWYAHGMDYLGFPLWLMPMHGLLAHWVLDAYWLVTLTDVRKATLP